MKTAKQIQPTCAESSTTLIKYGISPGVLTGVEIERDR